MNFEKHRPKALAIEGNIGAGKSTFLKIVQSYLDVQIVYEPHTKWQDVDGDNLLDKFYKDTKRWSYTFQTYAFVTRILEQEKHAKNSKKEFQVLERSVFSDRCCFAKNCFELGTMSPLEWQLYQEWFTWLVEGYVEKPAGFIYLRAEPNICHKRLQKRNRTEETGVSLDYLTMLHDKHENWLINKKDLPTYLKDIPVLSIECNNEFEADVEEQKKHIQKVADFFGVKYKN